jgi:sensor histidine kinase YesM
MNINRYHFYFWGFHFSFLFVLDYLYFKEDFIIAREFFMIFMQLSIFYSFLFALVKFKKGSIWNWVISIGNFLLSFGLILFLNHLRGKLAAYYDPDNILHENFGVLVNETISYYNVLALYATGYYFLMRYATKQKELRQLSEAKAAQDIAAAQLEAKNAQLALQNAQLAQEKATAELAAAHAQQDLLQMELNFLRAQINPHFLYNTLNYFYDRAMDNDAPLAQSMITLSEIMRYSLETTQGGQLTLLQKEVRHLQQVIGLYQLRASNRLYIHFATEGQYGQVQVAPLIFITLLENALKHGVVNNPQQPVTIRLAVDTTHIHFAIANTINHQRSHLAEHNHGIGLDNIKKRLHHVYGNRCRLEVNIEEERYEVAVEILYNE